MAQPVPYFEMALTPLGIGLFVMEWSRHEQMMAHLISLLEKRDYLDVRRELVRGSTSKYEKRLRVAAQRLASDHPIQPYIDQILLEHVRCRTIRHDIVHGHWIGLNPEFKNVMIRMPRGEEERVKAMSFQDMLMEVQKLQQLALPMINAQRTAVGDKPIPPHFSQ